MIRKQFATLFVVLVCLGLFAFAQDSSLTNVTGSGTKNKIAVFKGPHQIGNSIMTQSSGNVDVSGGVAATNSGNNVNTVNGTNTSAPGGTQGAGTYGELSSTGESGTGSGWANGGAGAWGDGGNDSNYAVLGTTENKSGGIFENNGGSYYTLFGFNFATGSTGYPFAVFNGDGAGCSIDPLGDLSCTGSKNAVVPVEGGKQHVALAAIESPKNWFEDFGSAQLMGGVAVVKLDSRFMQTVNTGLEYHVFLTPNGDCKGLYVHMKSPNSFEVRELGGGSSSVKFDYRITALRKNYEKVRFADHTREFSHIRSDGKVGEK